MDLLLSESIISANDRKSSLSNLKKYLSLYSEPESPEEFFFSGFLTMPNPVKSLKEFESIDTGLNSKNLSFSDLNLGQKPKQKLSLFKQENKNLLKEIQILNKALNTKKEEFRKAQAENNKYKKIVDYMLEELTANDKKIECIDDILPFLIKKFSVIKSTVMNTQKAYLKKKELNKYIKKENFKLQSENIANIELIIRMNEFRKNDEKDLETQGLEAQKLQKKFSLKNKRTNLSWDKE